MSELRSVIRRLIAFIRSGRAESDLAREIGAHLQLLEDDFVARGMSREQARYEARRQFHGVEQTKELQRDARSFRWLAGWSMDLKLGVRMLVKSPGLTAIAVIALTVAIGGGAAYMEFVNDFFRPRLAFAGSDRLVGILNYDPARADVEKRSLQDFAVWKTSLRRVTDLGALEAFEDNLLTEDGRLEPLRGVRISASAFRVIPAPPLHGRPLVADDERPGAPAVMVVGEDVWRSRFGANPQAVGRPFRLGRSTVTLVGVMPAGFGFPINSSLWVPLQYEPGALGRNEGPQIRIFGRLGDGVDLAAAQAELETVHASLLRDSSAAGTAETRPVVMPYVESLWATPDMNWQVVALYSFNLFFLALLGICAANVATLVFARTATRAGEITVRTALGASRGRIVAQLVAEALVLTSVAAIAGLWGATLILRKVREIFVASQGRPMPFWWDEQLGAETILYAVLLVVVAALLIGGVPALKATNARMQARLREAGAAGGSMKFGKLWTGVIVTQVAVTVIFLLTLASMALEARQVLDGFAGVTFPREQYLTATISIGELDANLTPAEAEARKIREKAALRELLRRLNEDSAIINATYAVRLPGGGQDEFRVEFAQPGVAAGAHPPGDVLWVRSSRVGTNYFETFSQPVVQGRSFTGGEVEAGRDVAVVDESFVRLILGGRNPIGLLVRDRAKSAEAAPGPWLEIIGVVRDISTLENKTTEDAMLYRPSVPGDRYEKRLAIHSRAADVAARLRAAVIASDPDLRLYEVMTMDRLAETEWQTFSFLLGGVGVVAAVALLLSTAGIYALISFTLSRRTREIGIRIALGAAPGRIVAGLLSRAFLQVGAGIALGSLLGIALLAAGMEAAEARSIRMAAIAAATVGAFVVGVAMISCVVPVRRALRTQPTEALRSDG